MQPHQAITGSQDMTKEARSCHEEIQAVSSGHHPTDPAAGVALIGFFCT